MPYQLITYHPAPKEGEEDTALPHAIWAGRDGFHVPNVVPPKGGRMPRPDDTSVDQSVIKALIAKFLATASVVPSATAVREANQWLRDELVKLGAKPDVRSDFNKWLGDPKNFTSYQNLRAARKVKLETAPPKGTISTYEDVGWTGGAFHYLTFTPGNGSTAKDLDERQRKMLLLGLLDHLNEHINKLGYVLCDTSAIDTPLLWFPDGSSSATPSDSTTPQPQPQPGGWLPAFVRLSLWDLQKVAESTWVRCETDSTNTHVRDELNLGRRGDTNGYGNLFVVTKVIAPTAGNLPASARRAAGQWALWVPKTLDNYYVEAQPSDGYFVQDRNNRIVKKLFPAASRAERRQAAALAKAQAIDSAGGSGTAAAAATADAAATAAAGATAAAAGTNTDMDASTYNYAPDKTSTASSGGKRASDGKDDDSKETATSKLRKLDAAGLDGISAAKTAQAAAATTTPGSAGAATQPVAPSTVPNANSCFYRVADNRLYTYLYRAELSGEGGNGAMRADRVSDALFAWAWLQDLPDGKGAWLRDALDLGRPSQPNPDRYRRVSAIGRAPASAKPTIVSMDSDIWYHKTFGPPPKPNKKNAPRDTKPLQSRDFKKSALAQYKLRKKQKGVWPANQAVRPAIALQANGYPRLDAGKEMFLALGEFGLPVGGSGSVSASEFAQWVVSNDAEAGKDWSTVLSKEFLPGDQKSQSAANKASAAGNAAPAANIPTANAASAGTTSNKKDWSKVVRTDQEWCHLIGHGDGGAEELANFVSGSKHCNTEQLAIELGQRGARLAYGVRLAAKITAYLFPNRGIWDYVAGRIAVAAKTDPKAPPKPYVPLWTHEQREILAQFEPTKINPAMAARAIIDIADQIRMYSYAQDGAAIATTGASAAQTAIKSKDDEKKPGGQAFVEGLLKDEKTPAASASTGSAGSATTAKLADVTRVIPTRQEFHDAKNQKRLARDIALRLYEIAVAPFPLADFIRYKIYYLPPATDGGPLAPQKVFDHVFDAQRESFDYNEFKILETTVRRAVAEASGNGAAYWSTIYASAVENLSQASGLANKSTAATSSGSGDRKDPPPFGSAAAPKPATAAASPAPKK